MKIGPGHEEIAEGRTDDTSRQEHRLTASEMRFVQLG